MKEATKWVLQIAIATGLLLTMAMPVGATPPIDGAITNEIPDLGTASLFTASGGVICESGTVANEHFLVAKRGLKFQVVKRFTCDDGSGEFFVKLEAKLSPETFTTTFRWNVLGGTGAYEGLHGSGSGFSTLRDPDPGIIDHYSGGFHLHP